MGWRMNCDVVKQRKGWRMSCDVGEVTERYVKSFPVFILILVFCGI